MEYLMVIYRTLLFYFIIMAVYRFMGKREVGELGIVDLIVSILIAELAAISIDNLNDSVFLSILPILVLVLLQIVMAKISLKHKKVRDLFDGNPSVIINRGRVNFKEMLKQRYNLDDLLTQLREKNIKSIEEVDYAILETSGKLSVFPKEIDIIGDYPLPLIMNGTVEEDILLQIKKSKTWLDQLLKKENVFLKDIFYAFYKDHKLFIIKNSDFFRS